MKTERKKEDQLIFKVIEYGIAEDKKGNPIVRGKMDAELEISDIDQSYLYEQLAFNYAGSVEGRQHQLLVNSQKTIGPNHILTRTNTGGSENKKDWQYRLLPSAIDSYYDYIELKEARTNATDAGKYSIAALIVSIASLLLAVFDVFGKNQV